MASDIESSQFGIEDVELIESELLYQGFFRMERLRFRHRRYRGDWSPPVERELLYRGVAVGALLYDPVHDLVGLVEQIRPGALQDTTGPWCLEVVAGIIEPGEQVEEVATRELQEEAGMTAKSLEYICEYYPSPGGCDERMHLYCALADLREAHGQQHGLDDECEDIQLLTLPATSVFEQLYGGRFNNASTLIALQWLQLNVERLRRQQSEMA